MTKRRKDAPPSAKTFTLYGKDRSGQWWRLSEPGQPFLSTYQTAVRLTREHNTGDLYLFTARGDDVDMKPVGYLYSILPGQEFAGEKAFMNTFVLITGATVSGGRYLIDGIRMTRKEILATYGEKREDGSYVATRPVFQPIPVPA